MVLVFRFGLVHGLGFAGARSDPGMPHNAFPTALAAFNLGAEPGQLLIILAVYFLPARPFGKRPWFRRRIVIPVPAPIAAVALWWTVMRLIARSWCNVQSVSSSAYPRAAARGVYRSALTALAQTWKTN